MTQEIALGMADYCVISLSMLISVFIGLFFRFTGSSQKTADDFLMGSRDMTRFPVVFSLVATKMSAISLIGSVTDTYLFGIQRLVGLVFQVAGAYIAAYVFLPVFFSVKSRTIYAYLEHRFGKCTKLLTSVLCFLQSYFYLSIVLYAPALALDAVTSLSLDASIILMGVVTIVFCTLGGMKAVMWGDVFQLLSMFVCLVTVLIFSFQEAAGFENVFKIALDGGRLNWLNFSTSLSERYTFWGALVLGIQPGIAYVCVSQSEMQRTFALKNLKDAQSAFIWSIIPTVVITLLTATIGLTLFSVFGDCNPLDAASGVGLGKADQILPYYIVSRMVKYPGLSGLCVSGLFCGAISSLSSAVNSMSTIAIDDFIQPIMSLKLNSKLDYSMVAKVLVVVNGSIITCLPFVFTYQNGLLEAVMIYNGILYCPILSVYLLGLLTETANEKGIFLGVISGVALSSWISVGARMSGKRDIPTGLSTEGCSFLNSTLQNATESTFTFPDVVTEKMAGSTLDSVFPLYQISFVWIAFIGMVTTFIVGYISSLVINCFEAQPTVESHLLSPVSRFWIKRRKDEAEYQLATKNENC